MKIFTAAFATALAIGSALFAQSSTDLLNVKFPAPVVVNGVTLPAGETSIRVIDNNGSMMLNVRSESGEQSVVLVNRGESNENRGSEAKVVFDEKEGVYYLNRVLLPDHTSLQVLDPQ
jgi:hypothetical protein